MTFWIESRWKPPRRGAKPRPNGPAGISVTVLLDGKPLPHVLDVAVFFDAIVGAGRFPLFTCTCGNFGCGGYAVDVVPTADAWIMRNRYSPDAGALFDEIDVLVPWDDLRDAAGDLLGHLAAIRDARPRLPIYANGTRPNLARCLDEFATRAARIGPPLG